MKKGNIIIIALAIFLTATAAFAQTNQIVKAEIPFDFEVRGKTYSAGEYVIRRAGDRMHGWTIAGLDKDSSSIYLLANTVDRREKEVSVLTFRRYGNRYFLAEFITASYKVKLPKTKNEKRLIKKRLRLEQQLAKAEIVNVKPKVD